MKQSWISHLNVKNTPVQFMSINRCTDLAVSYITLDSSDGDTQGGHNTDAFDVGDSTNVSITNCNIHNQDDCIAINSGTNIKFDTNICIAGHGISIGSVGNRANNVVEKVEVNNCAVQDSDNGVRIKTIAGATGSVSGISYTDVTLTNIVKYGVVIQQDYQNGNPTNIPTNGVPITDVTLKNVKGTMSSDALQMYILCGDGSCSQWNFTEVSLEGGKTSDKCTNVPDAVAAAC